MGKLLLFVVLVMQTSMAWSYTAKNSTEAILTFKDWVELPDFHSPRAANQAIKEQLNYLFGPLSIGSVLAAPKEDQEISDVQIIQKPDGNYVATYVYKGTIVLKDGPTDQIKLMMPNNPFTIWQASVENLKANQLNPCTDPDYQSEGDFWYFWSPLRPGCNKYLKEGRDYHTIVGHVARKPNMRISFPEYTKLPDENGRIQVTLIMGKDEPSRIRSPYNRKKGHDDLNAINYRKIAAELKQNGFTERQWTNEEIKTVVRKPLSPYPFVLEFSKKFKGPYARELVVQMVYTTIDIASQSNGFHYFLEYALEQSAVTIYDGHSGLGGNLDLSSIRSAVNNSFKFNLNKTRYQIYFFSSCTSYAYYNDVFFAKKVIPGSSDQRGSKYLDILTSGMETPFDGSVKVNLALIQAINYWAATGKKTSYQQLAQRMENMDNLFGVNGDEDNQ